MKVLLLTMVLFSTANAATIPSDTWTPVTETHINFAGIPVFIPLYADPISVGVIEGNKIKFPDFTLHFPAAHAEIDFERKGVQFHGETDIEPFTIGFQGGETSLTSPDVQFAHSKEQIGYDWIGTVGEAFAVFTNVGNAAAHWSVSGPTESMEGDYHIFSAVGSISQVIADLGPNNEINSWHPRNVQSDMLEVPDYRFGIYKILDGVPIIVSSHAGPEPATLSLLIPSLLVFLRRF